MEGASMSAQVGVKEFKDKATQMLRRVREQREEIIVTMDGEPIALVRPFTEQDRAKLTRDAQSLFLTRGKALARRAGAGMLSEAFDALEAVTSQRRVL
jgi:prevent-host-death family protein